jgi:hypothetical protein
LDCHDLHAWTITLGLNLVSAHVVLAEEADPASALDSRASRLPPTLTSATRPSSSKRPIAAGSKSGATPNKARGEIGRLRRAFSGVA